MFSEAFVSSKGCTVKKAKGCTRRTLAEVSGYRVESCSCGLFHVHIGPVSVRMEPSAFLTFSEVIEDSVEMMGSPAAEVAVNHGQVIDMFVPIVAES